MAHQSINPFNDTIVGPRKTIVETPFAVERLTVAPTGVLVESR
jgi:hypothetical protein